MYLENLSFRAYIAVYGPRETLGDVFRRFIGRDFPRAVRALRLHLLASLVLLAAGFLAGYAVVGEDPQNYYSIIPAPMAPVQVTDTREEILREEIFAPWPGFERTFVVFANFLFRHNSKVAILSFCLSFALGVPTAALVFQNGRILGAMVSLHAQKDLAIPYLAWLSIHGVTELLAFLLASAAGLSIAQALALPGGLSRRESLSRAGGRAGTVMLGAVFMLFIASVLEGGFRQLITLTAGRAFFALFTGLFWYWYFTSRGREAA
ncbi:MAG: stage II sporulation protein M [Deltaproteobacteria bacterium]|nr:stage II sporulation protein M [Deltaproteobacteria bacterium]